jgi:hypothetical protein
VCNTELNLHKSEKLRLCFRIQADVVRELFRREISVVTEILFCIHNILTLFVFANIP